MTFSTATTAPIRIRQSGGFTGPTSVRITPGHVAHIGTAVPFHTTVSSAAGLGVVLSIGLLVFSVIAGLSMVSFLVILIVANRAEPDPTGGRPQSVYFFAVSFLTLVTSVIGATAVFTAVVQFIGTHHGTIGNAVARAVVLGGLVTAVSVALLVVHLRRGLDLAGAEGTPNPSRRVGQSYVGVASFFGIVLVLLTAIAVVYLLFSLGGPGVFGSIDGRGTTTRVIADLLFLGAIGVVILRTHRDLVPPGLAILKRRPPVTAAGAPAAAPPSPASEERAPLTEDATPTTPGDAT